jgi:hypothetical protein
VWDGTSWDIQANDSITETPLPPTSSALAAVASQQYAAQAAARIRALVAEMEEDRLRHEQGAAAGAVRRASVEVSMCEGVACSASMTIAPLARSRWCMVLNYSE